MKLQILACSRTNDKFLEGKTLTITGGYITGSGHGAYRDAAAAATETPLEQARWFFATDGRDKYKFCDTRQEFAKAIAAGTTGKMDMHLAISILHSVGTSFIDSINILSYE